MRMRTQHFLTTSLSLFVYFNGAAGVNYTVSARESWLGMDVITLVNKILHHETDTQHTRYLQVQIIQNLHLSTSNCCPARSCKRWKRYIFLLTYRICGNKCLFDKFFFSALKSNLFILLDPMNRKTTNFSTRGNTLSTTRKSENLLINLPLLSVQ